MKTEFFEYYKPTESDLRKAWRKSLFTFDANVLLSLYRYTDASRKDLLSTLTNLGTKIWLTHQACYEYFENRLPVIEEQAAAYKQVIEIVEKDLARVVEKLGSLEKRHSNLPADQIKKKAKTAYNSVVNQIKKHGKSHPDLFSNDTINEALDALFSGKIGEAYAKEKYSELYKEGAHRYDKKIPPGYKDRDKEKDKHEPDKRVYGDLILWKQIIDKAKVAVTSVVFVTNDLKEDWWEISKGMRQGPRRELLREFYENTKQKIYILSLDSFLEYANKFDGAGSVKDKTIKEVTDVMQKDVSISSDAPEIKLSNETIRHLQNIFSKIDTNQSIHGFKVQPYGPIDPVKYWDGQLFEMTHEERQNILSRFEELQKKLNESSLNLDRHDTLDAIKNATRSFLDNAKENTDKGDSE